MHQTLTTTVETCLKYIKVKPFEDDGPEHRSGIIISGKGQDINIVIMALLDVAEEAEHPYPLFAPRAMKPEPNLVKRRKDPSIRAWRIFTDELHHYGNETMESILDLLEKKANRAKLAA